MKNRASKAQHQRRSSDDYDDIDDEDYDYSDEARYRSSGPKAVRRAVMQQAARVNSRSRPTNNQLLYKAYFRWAHYPFKMVNGTDQLPTETDACPSVTAAFLQVLHTLHVAETCRVGQQRNMLQILSTNTRRTKVVELSTGTHRVPDELRKHYLSDGERGQYSTNLDRNRYGNDDQYLFTVVRYDLEYLGLCPCMVDVEIIDAKNDNQSIFVSAGPEACTCNKDTVYPAARAEQHYSNKNARHDDVGVMPQSQSPKRSGSGVSQLFDALVMAATGGTEGAAAGGIGGEAVDSRFGAQAAAQALALVGGGAGPSSAAAAAVAAVRQHGLPVRQKSRLWSALSYGDVDSLQNALDAFRAEDEIASGPNLSDALNADAFRKRQRKAPVRGPSSSLLAFDSSLLGSLLKGSGLSGLKEKSGDNATGDVISSGHAPEAVGSQGDDSGEPDLAATKATATGPDPGEEREDLDGHVPVNNRRVRHVPRQSSAVNLTTRMAPAELKRLTVENDSLRQEVRRLELQLNQFRQGGEMQSPLNNHKDADSARLRQLETEMQHMRQEVQGLLSQKQEADRKVATLTQELNSTRHTANAVLSRILQSGQGLAAFGVPPPQPPAGLPSNPLFNKQPSSLLQMQPGLSVLGSNNLSQSMPISSATPLSSLGGSKRVMDLSGGLRRESSKVSELEGPTIKRQALEHAADGAGSGGLNDSDETRFLPPMDPAATSVADVLAAMANGK